MRIAALAFGVLAGLVASFILALGGLDAAGLRHLDGRQMQLVTFGLFVVANLGVLGAGLVLAAPLAGTALFVLGAVGWVVAALALHHGPDYVMLTPPGILILAAALSVAAFIRRRQRADEDEDFGRHQAIAAQRAAMRDAEVETEAERENEDESDDSRGEPSGVAVGASFFGDAGTATPLRGAMPAPPDARRDNWEPVRRRVEPPRQKPIFRSVEDEYDDEESGVSRVARGVSSVLSFGLYAALAAVVVLVFWNLRSGDVLHRNTATKLEASASASAPRPKPPAPSKVPTVVAEAPTAPTLVPAPTASVSPELIAPSAARSNETAQLAAPASSLPPAARMASSSPASSSQPQALPAGVVVAEASPATSAASVASAASAASSDAVTSSSASQPPPTGDLAASAASAPPMPYPMPPQIAAGRPSAKPRPATPVTTSSSPADIGL